MPRYSQIHQTKMFTRVPGAGTAVTVLQTAQQTDVAPAGYMRRFRHPVQTSWLWAPENCRAKDTSVCEFTATYNRNLCFKKGPFHALQHPSQQINLYSSFRQLFFVPYKNIRKIHKAEGRNCCKF
jgi:hypothetical protein